MESSIYLVLAILSTVISAIARIIIENIGKEADPNQNELQQQRLKYILLDLEFILNAVSVILLVIYIFRN